MRAKRPKSRRLKRAKRLNRLAIARLPGRRLDHSREAVKLDGWGPRCSASPSRFGQSEGKAPVVVMTAGAHAVPSPSS